MDDQLRGRSLFAIPTTSSCVCRFLLPKCIAIDKVGKIGENRLCSEPFESLPFSLFLSRRWNLGLTKRNETKRDTNFASRLRTDEKIGRILKIQVETMEKGTGDRWSLATLYAYVSCWFPDTKEGCVKPSLADLVLAEREKKMVRWREEKEDRGSWKERKENIKRMSATRSRDRDFMVGE